MHIRHLPAPLKPLAEKFYRSQRSVIGKTANAQIWVAQDQQIVAALVLHPVAGGHWLTSLLVAQERRNQGIARQLIDAAQSACNTPVWLFCHPELCNFYTRLGFANCPQLPEQLADRLTRYQRHKSLCAMLRLRDTDKSSASK